MFIFMCPWQMPLLSDIQYNNSTLKQKYLAKIYNVNVYVRQPFLCNLSKAVQQTLSENYSAPFKTLWLNYKPDCHAAVA